MASEMQLWVCFKKKKNTWPSRLFSHDVALYMSCTLKHAQQAVNMHNSFFVFFLALSQRRQVVAFSLRCRHKSTQFLNSNLKQWEEDGKMGAAGRVTKGSR